MSLSELHLHRRRLHLVKISDFNRARQTGANLPKSASRASMLDRMLDRRLNRAEEIGKAKAQRGP
jgi:hypothetical protein